MLGCGVGVGCVKKCGGWGGWLVVQLACLCRGGASRFRRCLTLLHGGVVGAADVASAAASACCARPASPNPTDIAMPPEP